MSSVQSWHSTMSFSDRLPKIIQITAKFKQANPESSQSEAKAIAKALEKEAYQKATTQEEYDRLCDNSFTSTNEASAEQSIRDASPSDMPILSISDLRIGKYTNAIHHRSGLFSTVYKAINPTPTPTLVALKVTNPSSNQPPHDPHREVHLLRFAASPHVIPLLEAFPQPGGLIALAFPYIPYDLSTLLHPAPLSSAVSPSSAVSTLNLQQRKFLVRDILHALAHIHALGIIHRDIKPSNILLKSPSGPGYLIDFGIACATTDDRITDVGTTCYRAPELLFGCTWYGAGIDLWALGCVVAEIVTWGGREVGSPSAASSGPTASSVEGGKDEDLEEMRRQWRERGTLFDSGELGSDLALLLSVFRSLGTPTAETWPEAKEFPDWGKMEFYEFDGKGWEVLLPGADELAIDFVGKLVTFESKERMGAQEALGHAWVANA